MATLIVENFKFLSVFFKSKDVVIFNSLIALGTVASQTAYNIFAFECPCSSQRNYLYGIAAIGVPALALFFIGIMLNRNTWDLISECRLRKCQKLSAAPAFSLLGSIVGRASVAPITWSVISLLRGEAYVCALSEFLESQTLEVFPFPTIDPRTMARFPCKDVPAELQRYWKQIERRLKYESQLLGWLIIAVISVALFLVVCMKRCCSPLGYQQETYWSSYRSIENGYFQRTAEAHAKIRAAENVQSFFGFVVLDKEEKDLMAANSSSKKDISSQEWNRITGVSLYRENNNTPLYSRLHKWATYTTVHNYEHDGTELEEMLG